MRRYWAGHSLTPTLSRREREKKDPHAIFSCGESGKRVPRIFLPRRSGEVRWGLISPTSTLTPPIFEGESVFRQSVIRNPQSTIRNRLGFQPVMILLLLLCAISSASADGHLTGSGSGQLIPPNTCTTEPLTIRLERTEQGFDQPVRFTVISTPKGAQGYGLIPSPTDTGSPVAEMDRVLSASGEATIYFQVGDTEGAYIITAEHPAAENVITFFVHARRKVWKYLIPVAMIVGVGLAGWGVYLRRKR